MLLFLVLGLILSFIAIVLGVAFDLEYFTHILLGVLITFFIFIIWTGFYFSTFKEGEVRSFGSYNIKSATEQEWKDYNINKYKEKINNIDGM